jgi:hypothetical protein
MFVFVAADDSPAPAISISLWQAAVALFCSVAALLHVADLYAFLCPALVHTVGNAGKTLRPLLFRDASGVCVILSMPPSHPLFSKEVVGSSSCHNSPHKAPAIG